MTTELERWAQWMRAAGRSPATVRTRRAGMRTLCRHAGVTSVTAVTADQVAAWLADCAKPWTRCTYWMTRRHVRPGFLNDEKPPAHEGRGGWPCIRG